MRIILLSIVSTLFFTGCLPDLEFPTPATPDNPIWSQRAAISQTALNETFWIPQTYRYKEFSNDDGGNIYWWNAHAAEVMVDGYLRTGDEFYQRRLLKLESTFYNQYVFFFSYLTTSYDDMLWLALAYQRAHEIMNKSKFKRVTTELWGGIKTGWSNSPHDGGIYWSLEEQFLSSLKFKNTPSNAPASILASRLYRQFGNKSDSSWAIKIHDWQKEILVDPVTGIVWDGIQTTGVLKDIYAYNQGTYIGENTELYRISGNYQYILEAIRTADYFINNYTENGILRIDENGRDGGLFKGIFVRYLTELILYGDLDGSKEAAYVNFLQTNANALWNNAREPDLNIFTGNWAATGNINWEVSYLSDHLSGVILLEMMAKLERMDYL